MLWDLKSGSIVNNESSELLRMLNSSFNSFAKHPEIDLYPEALKDKIDAVNEWIYPMINNGVYKCGFATTQEAYTKAFHELFEGLDKAEAILSKSKWLTGDEFTEADVRLFTTLARFDAVYVGHFKCNKYRLADKPGMSRFLKDVMAIEGIRETVNMKHIKEHYYGSHKTINPTGVVPIGPDMDWV